MRLSRIWRIKQIKEGVIGRGGYNTLRDLFNSSYPMKDEFITPLFTNMRILKLKSQLMIALFAAVHHLNGPLRKQYFTLTVSKGHRLWFVIGGFQSILCVSVFQGSLLVIIIMIDGSEKCNSCEGGLWTLEFACLWKAQ